MVWSKNPKEAQDSPPVFYHSKALTGEQVRKEMLTVFKDIIERRSSVGAPEDAQVLFVLNSVNSYIDISWTDKSYEPLGDWTYTIWFLPFGEACLEHPDGTDHFVTQMRFAIFDMVYDYYYDCHGDDFETMVCYPLCYFLVPEYRDTPEYIIM